MLDLKPPVFHTQMERLPLLTAPHSISCRCSRTRTSQLLGVAGAGYSWQLLQKEARKPWYVCDSGGRCTLRFPGMPQAGPWQ